MIQCKGNCIRLLASSGISRQKRRGVVEEEEGNQTNLRTLMAMIEFPCTRISAWGGKKKKKKNCQRKKKKNQNGAGLGRRLGSFCF